ncbi:Protein BATH-38 [Aphelenchoides avenae]|nr:Protein BATH-38 [Aphelenchus avenae]
MFSGDFRENEADVVQLEDVQPKHFPKFLRVVYPSRKEITSSSIFHLLVLADRFDVVALMVDCMEYPEGVLEHTA